MEIIDIKIKGNVSINKGESYILNGVVENDNIFFSPNRGYCECCKSYFGDIYKHMEIRHSNGISNYKPVSNPVFPKSKNILGTCQSTKGMYSI